MPSKVALCLSGILLYAEHKNCVKRRRSIAGTVARAGRGQDAFRKKNHKLASALREDAIRVFNSVNTIRTFSHAKINTKGQDSS